MHAPSVKAPEAERASQSTLALASKPPQHSPVRPGSGAAGQLLTLQRTIGNQVVLPLLAQRDESITESESADRERMASPEAVRSAPCDFSAVPVFAPDGSSGGGAARPTGECEACHGEGKTRQRRTAGGIQTEAAVPPGVSEVLRQPGEPLDAAWRAYFEPRFEHDFSAVRVHADPAAAQSARTVDALAYTFGRHIVLGTGPRVADTLTGRALLAHELAHVVQQTGGTALSPPGAVQERDAEAAMRCVMSGTIPQVRAPSGVGVAAQRSADTERLVNNVIPYEPEPYEPEPRMVRFDEISALVNRVIISPRTTVWHGRTDFNKNPQLAKTRLYHSHFRSEEERLSYALGMFKQFVASDTGVVDPDVLYSTLLNYEVQVQSQTAGLVVHHWPPTTAEQKRLKDLRAEREQRLKDLRAKREQRHQEQLSKLRADRTLATRAKRYDLNLAYQGKSPSDPQAWGEDVTVDPSVLSRDEFFDEKDLRMLAEAKACGDENIRPGTKQRCRLAVKEKYLGREYMARSFAEVRAQWNGGAYIENIKNSGPVGLTGRVIGRSVGYLIGGDKGADVGEQWGALFGGVGDVAVAIRAGAGARERIKAYDASGGLEVGLGEIVDVTNAPRQAPPPTPMAAEQPPATASVKSAITAKPVKPATSAKPGDITKQPPLGPDEAFRSLSEEMALTGTGRLAAVPARSRNQYLEFEDVPKGLESIAEEQARRLSSQLGIPIRKDRVLAAPWIGRIRGSGGKARSSSTSKGWERNEGRFWGKWKSAYPEDAKLLGPNYTVTEALAKKYGWPTSGPNNTVGQKLVHHHMENGSLTVAIPESVHQQLSGKIHGKATVVGE